MTNKIVVVVGASKGIGKAIVKHLIEQSDCIVYALSRNLPALEDAFGSIDSVIIGAIDLQQENLHQQLNTIFEHVPQIDIVINNAGLLIKKPFLELTRADINNCYQTNSIGIMHATQYFVPKMIKSGGHIVNISSMGAYQGSVKFPTLSAYSSSKAGLTCFTELFAEEYKASKIKMNCLCLGAVETEMFKAAFPDGQAPHQPNEIASYIVDFAFRGSNYYNGKILPVSLSTP